MECNNGFRGGFGNAEEGEREKREAEAVEVMLGTEGAAKGAEEAWKEEEAWVGK